MNPAELADDVCDESRVEKETLRELQTDLHTIVVALKLLAAQDLINGFGHFIVVVPRKD